jgi:hypothetical protein
MDHVQTDKSKGFEVVLTKFSDSGRHILNLFITHVEVIVRKMVGRVITLFYFVDCKEKMLKTIYVFEVNSVLKSLSFLSHIRTKRMLITFRFFFK